MKRQILIFCIVIALAGAVESSSFTLSDISVEGVIYCRCKLPGYVARVDSSPLSGIVASLKCDIGSYHTVVNATTDSYGYFKISAKMMKNYVGHYCSVYVISSPLSQCIVPPQLTFTGKGANLIYMREEPGVEFQYSAGLMLVGPAKSASCHS